MIVEAPVYVCSVLHYGTRVMACNDGDCELPRAETPNTGLHYNTVNAWFQDLQGGDSAEAG